MTIIKDHKITGTVSAALDYVLKDKTDTTGSKDVDQSLSYAISDKETGETTYRTRRSSINCNPANPYSTFEKQMEKFGADEIRNGSKYTKDGKPVLAWHYIQSFDGVVDPNVAHEIGRKFAEEIFPGFPVVIGTHTNTQHTHNHIIVCAWNLDGKKWRQRNDVYQHAREVSDRLSEEYGLSVLQKTRQQKLTRWKDKNGQIHYYEPTDRKNSRLRQRQSGKISGDEVSSYRNTYAYDRSKNKEQSLRKEVKEDIDKLLPMAKSYNHLLWLLRQSGYKVKEKRKDGSYLKYITFIPPGHTKGVRDKTLSDDGFYLRENLEQKIQEENLTARHTEKEKADTKERVNRNTKSKQNEIRYRRKNRGRKQYYRSKSDLDLGKEIRENLQAALLMEKEDVYTREETDLAIEETKIRYEMCVNAIEDLKAMNSELESLIKIKEKIKERSGDSSYSDIEKEEDEALDTKGTKTIEELKRDVEETKKKINEMEEELNTQADRLNNLECCNKVLDRVFKEEHVRSDGGKDLIF